ncbi:MAG: uncharacterized protein KVP18_003811 [Porospora cf. gigantea A]|nr:MAG: hypothetical protein KVP18_003811 [Porospora cf. gigantea A]
MGPVAQRLGELMRQHKLHVEIIERLVTRNARLLARLEPSRNPVGKELGAVYSGSLESLYAPYPVSTRVRAEVEGRPLCACSEILDELYLLLRDRFEWHERLVWSGQVNARDAHIEELQVRLLATASATQLDPRSSRLAEALEHLSILERSLAFEKIMNQQWQSDFREVHRQVGRVLEALKNTPSQLEHSDVITLQEGV